MVDGRATPTRRGGSMELFLEWLLLELAAVALQVAILRILDWVQGRSLSPEPPATMAVAA